MSFGSLSAGMMEAACGADGRRSWKKPRGVRLAPWNPCRCHPGRQATAREKHGPLARGLIFA